MGLQDDTLAAIHGCGFMFIAIMQAFETYTNVNVTVEEIGNPL